VMVLAYWTRSLSARDRLQHLTSGQHHPHLGCDDVILDDETRRLLDDSHLLIATQRLALLDIIGQGPLRRSHSCTVLYCCIGYCKHLIVCPASVCLSVCEHDFCKKALFYSEKLDLFLDTTV